MVQNMHAVVLCMSYMAGSMAGPWVYKISIIAHKLPHMDLILIQASGKTTHTAACPKKVTLCIRCAHLLCFMLCVGFAVSCQTGKGAF